MRYELDGKDYNIDIIRKNNKNTYVRIKDDLTIQVTTNYFASKRDIKDILDRNQDFLRKNLYKKNKEIEKKEKFYYLGKEYDVVIVPTFKNIELSGSKIYVSDIKDVDKWLKKETIRIFQERLEYNYNRFEENIPFPKLRIRSMKTRWGVCNRRNLTVTINSTLIRESMDAIDYVIIHELSHLVHFNHSNAFWQTVGKYFPKYKQVRKELRE